MEAQQPFPAGFGDLLKTARKHQRLTQQQLAARLGVHANTISSWELGTYLPATRSLVLELARLLALDEPATRQLLEASLTTLEPHWSVPWPRNPFFTGREETLSLLHTQIGIKQAVALTQSSALHGLGGVGKTQIALEYAYRYALDYRAVFWIAAETAESMLSSLLHLAETLQVPERADKDQQRIIAAVQRWLTTHGQWLLIWDNVEDLALLQRFLPATRQGAILITTRLQVLGTLARRISLSPMEPEEGLLFLLRRAKVLLPEATSEHLRQFAGSRPAAYADARELVLTLGGLPLALDQAGAYLEATQCSLPVYLEQFRTQRAALLQLRGAGVRDHPASVATTFGLALAATTRQHPAVRELLRVCALLHFDAIPEELFRQGAEHLGGELSAATGSDLMWDQLMAAACGYSLLSRQPELQTLSLHPLVQAVVLESMTQTEREQWSQRTINALAVVFPEMQPTTAYAVWKQGERLLPHALLCVRRAGAGEATLFLASLAYKLAQYLRECGRYAEAEPLYLSALQIRKQMLGPEHPEVASSLHYLAWLYENLSRYAEAEPLYLSALQIREQTLGSEHPEVARTLNNLANLYWMQGKYAEAEPLYLRALRLWEQAQGPDHPATIAFPLNNLANLYWMQGKYAEAELLCLRALQIREETLGPSHPLVATSLNNLAGIYWVQGRYDEAEPLYQRARTIREQALGPEHPDIAVSLNNLAELYQAQGRYAEAEPLYQRARTIWEQALGPDHPYVAQALHGLATLYTVQARYAEAEPLYQRALALQEQQFGQHHLDIAQTLHDLAVLYQQQGKLNEALSLAERTLHIRSQALGEAHLKTIDTQTLYARLVQEQGALKHDRALLPEMSVTVRGATAQPAYTRRVSMREVTFTCTVCGQTFTQLHYPSGKLKYCSEACKAVSVAQRQEARVARQREKRQAVRETQVQSRQHKDV